MQDARNKFFSNMQRDFEVEDEHNVDLNTSHLDIDFSITESGRTVAHMVTDDGKDGGMADDMDFSLTSSGRLAENMLLSEAERDDLLSTLASPDTEGDSSHVGEGATNTSKNDTTLEAALDAAARKTTSRSHRSIPIPKPSSHGLTASLLQPQSSTQQDELEPSSGQNQSSSYESSGSAFLSSVLNLPGTVATSTSSTASTLAHPPLPCSTSKQQYPQQHPQPLQDYQQPPRHSMHHEHSLQQQQLQTNSTSLLSHTPPTHLGSSYEAAHFGKRARSGSVSGRLRSASEYLEDKGLLDRQTRGMLKDLIIMGDEELQEAMDRYEAGDPTQLESMIQSGGLQDRMPKDIDIMGDLDLDFLNMQDDDLGAMQSLGQEASFVASVPEEQQERRYDVNDADMNVAETDDSSRANVLPSAVGKDGKAFYPPNMVSPSYDDDGIGDLEFSGDFVSDQADYMQIPHQTYGAAGNGVGGSKNTSVSGSPSEATNMSDYEKRMRSNSLFSALLNDPRSSTSNAKNPSEANYGQWMESLTASGSNATANNKKKTDVAGKIKSKNTKKGIQINGTANKPGRKPTGKSPVRTKSGGIGASLEADKKRREKQEKKERKEKKALEKKRAAVEQEMEEYLPGSGRPRALSDPNLTTSVDVDGLRQVERPDGWVGAYSPESRKVRIDKFLAKRNHRVWTKTVKYDVRKNFADSRLRVKGRFVKKEDELLMRELMSLT